MLLEQPEVLLLEIINYLPMIGQIQLTSSCKSWNPLLIARVRKVGMNITSMSSMQGDIGKILRLIQDPFRQLRLSFEDCEDYSMKWTGYVPNGLFQLEVNIQQFLLFQEFQEQFAPTVKLQNLRLQSDIEDTNSDIVTALALIQSKLSAVKSLKLTVQNALRRGISYSIPDLPQLEQLEMIGNCHPSPFQHFSINNLRRLSLYYCDITDVSMLGSIPHLSLYFCYNLEDISSLKWNDTVYIDDCKTVQDYTQSFEHSRKITIYISDTTNATIDLTRWRTVEELFLFGSDSNIQFVNSREIPTTVRCCILRQQFPELMDLRISEKHTRIRKLVIEDHRSLTSLTSLGWERVLFLEIHYFSKLANVEELSGGRTQSITIVGCPQLHDLIPLQHVKNKIIYSGYA